MDEFLKEKCLFPRVVVLEVKLGQFGVVVMFFDEVELDEVFEGFHYKSFISLKGIWLIRRRVRFGGLIEFGLPGVEIEFNCYDGRLGLECRLIWTHCVFLKDGQGSSNLAYRRNWLWWTLDQALNKQERPKSEHKGRNHCNLSTSSFYANLSDLQSR